MYAEIKANNNIIINRLDNEEKILLEDIYKSLKSEEVTLDIEDLRDADGTFGGISIKVNK